MDAHERERSARRPAARSARSAASQQRPWKQLTRPYAPIEILSRRPGRGDPRDGADHPRRDRHAGAGAARRAQLYRAAGAKSTKARCGCASTAPWSRSWSRRRRRPSRFAPAIRRTNVKVGGADCIFSSVGGPAYVMDNDRGRRTGTYAEMCDYLKLIQSLNILHQEGGGPFEPLDLRQTPAISTSTTPRSRCSTRTGSRRPSAAAAPSMRWKWWRSRSARRARIWWSMPVFTGIINTNSPLAARHADGRRADRDGRAWPGQCHHAFHAGRRHVAGDARRRAWRSSMPKPWPASCWRRSCGRAFR